MDLRSVLERKPRAGTLAIDADSSMKSAVDLLVEHNIGALCVVSQSRLVGIVTERDILRQVAINGGEFLTRRVADVMTSNVLVGTYADDVEWAMRVMTEKRFRHMPIMDNGALVGMVSLGDMVLSQVGLVQTECRYLRDYIAGYYS
jgi:CBS domain-containing protein